MRTKVNIPDFTQRFTDVALTKRNAIYAGLSQKVDGLPDTNIESIIIQTKRMAGRIPPTHAYRRWLGFLLQFYEVFEFDLKNCRMVWLFFSSLIILKGSTCKITLCHYQKDLLILH